MSPGTPATSLDAWPSLVCGLSPRASFSRTGAKSAVSRLSCSRATRAGRRNHLPAHCSACSALHLAYSSPAATSWRR